MKRSAISGILFGLIVVALGTIFLFGGIFGWGIGLLAATWWSIIIIALALASIVRSGLRFWNILLLLFGVWLLLTQLGILAMRLFPAIFALAIIAIGITIIYGAISRHHIYSTNTSGNQDNNNFPVYDCVFSEHSVKNVSKMFKGARISCVFGQMFVDLSDIQIEGNVVIDASAVFGALEIKVPQNISNRTTITPVFGSFINNAPTSMSSSGSPYIEIKGAAVFSKVTLI